MDRDTIPVEPVSPCSGLSGSKPGQTTSPIIPNTVVRCLQASVRTSKGGNADAILEISITFLGGEFSNSALFSCTAPMAAKGRIGASANRLSLSLYATSILCLLWGSLSLMALSHRYRVSTVNERQISILPRCIDGQAVCCH